MKEILTQYASYNLWANQKMIDTIAVLPVVLQEKNIVSSFSSIRLTVEHLIRAESGWWQRMKLIDAPLPEADASKKMSEVCKQLLAQSTQWKEWVEKSTLAVFEHEFVYRNTKKELFKQPIYQMLLHLFNHQTYHRGQLVTMLRQAGVMEIPVTDFIAWSRGKKN